MNQDFVKVKFNFFRIQTRQRPNDLHEILAKIQKYPVDERTMMLAGTPRMLLDRKHMGEFSGHKSYLFTTKRTKRLPRKIDSHGNPASLNLANDEGLGEDVAVAINSTCEIAAIQFNQYSMRETAISKYINNFFPDININFLPIVKFDSMERVKKATEVKKFYIGLAGTLNFEKLRQYGLSANDAIMFQNLYSSPCMNLQWSVGRKKEGLASRLLSLIPIFKKYSEDNETKEITSLSAQILETTGDDVQSVFVDLLSDRLHGKVDVAINPNREIDEEDLLLKACKEMQSKYEEYSEYMENK